MGRTLRITFSLIGFISGIGFHFVIDISLISLIILFFVFLFIFFISRKNIISNIFLFLLFFSAGLIRSNFEIHNSNENYIDFYNSKKVTIEGLIIEKDVRLENVKYKVEVEKIFNQELNSFKNISGLVLFTLNKFPQYDYGDRIKLIGELKNPGEFNGFNYDNYLSRYNIFSVMYYPKIDLIEKNQGNFFWSVMFKIQNIFLSQINKLLPEPHSSFEAGLLVGARKGIPDDLMEKFNITGLTHIIAISGFNITIIIVFIMWILSSLPRKISFIVSVVIIILFTLFVGASPAVTRASIMGILGLLALNFGRQSNINLTILWTAFFMIFWNPKILWWDIGFQLSFGAVLGLIYIAPIFKKYTEKLPEFLAIKEAVIMTLSAQVIALPIIIYNFERLSLIAPISNLLVAFAIPFAMLFGFIGVIISFIIFPIGQIFAYIAWGILSYIIKIIELSSSIPFASINIKFAKFWMIFLYYFLLIIFLFFYNKKIKK